MTTTVGDTTIVPVNEMEDVADNGSSSAESSSASGSESSSEDNEQHFEHAKMAEEMPERRAGMVEVRNAMGVAVGEMAAHEVKQTHDGGGMTPMQWREMQKELALKGPDAEEAKMEEMYDQNMHNATSRSSGVVAKAFDQFVAPVIMLGAIGGVGYLVFLMLS